MTPIKVFFLEPTDIEKRWLRRYRLSASHTCSNGSYCNAMFVFGEGPVNVRGWAPPRTDPRWPTKCDICGQPFNEREEFQEFANTIYVCKATGLRTTLREAPPGACWNASWIADRRDGQGCGSLIGPDGRCLVVKCPDGHDWMIDARASNCTMPDEGTHHCWVRHGTPEDGTLHVDKNGHTCAAGAGSILTPRWHGFLHNGFLHELESAPGGFPAFER
ncbi:hypothetical protein [Bradyrhizobium yuanmingense]|uniref:hypothetical protein n=1 Tax=Bradyrhizobium yuanmingense TaxID=108015 RepID=UPI00055E6A26|nr:hypothetical protein [Bradyrhizobium yuanmingense]